MRAGFRELLLSAIVLGLIRAGGGFAKVTKKSGIRNARIHEAFESAEIFSGESVTTLPTTGSLVDTSTVEHFSLITTTSEIGTASVKSTENGHGTTPYHPDEGTTNFDTETATNPSATSTGSTTELEETTTLTYTLLVSISSKSDRSLSIIWNPLGPNLLYRVALTTKEPNHEIPPDCVGASLPTIEDYTQENSFVFEDLLPDYNYRIEVSITINKKNVSNVIIEATNAAAPGRPRHITATTCGDEFCPTMDLEWKIPCDSNGKLDHYLIDYEGVDQFDNQIYRGTKMTKFTTFTLENLMPSTNYTLQISAVGENNEAGLPTSYEFVTKHIIPKAPIVSISNITSSGFRISWEDPNEQANITGFFLKIASLDAAYPRNNHNCSKPNTSDVHELKNVSSYLFQKAFPYYEYNVSIIATSLGRFDSPPGFQVVTTKTKTPAPVQDVDFAMNETSMTAKLSWNLPCDINGIIEYMKVDIEGAYTEDPSDRIDFNNLTLNFTQDEWYYEYPNILLRESFNYNTTVTIILEDGTQGEQVTITNTTMAGIPGIPRNVRQTDQSDTSFTLEWTAPIEHKGKIISYRASISEDTPLYYLPDSCRGKNYSMSNESNATSVMLNGAKAFHSYSVSVKAKTERGYGKPFEGKFSTTESVPDAIEYFEHNITNFETEEYNASVQISLKRPCYTNGPLEALVVNYFGFREWNQISGSVIRKIEHNEVAENFTLGFELKPEYKYTYDVLVSNNLYNSTVKTGSFESPSGVPIFSPPVDYVPISNVGSKQAEIVLSKELLNHTNGEIQYIALIIATKNITGEKFQSWNYTQWPSLNADEFKQITPNFWNPFKTVNSVTYVIGDNSQCSSNNSSCSNEPLEPNKEYYLTVRLFTKNFYRNSQSFKFQTERLVGVGAIVGIIFGILAFALIGFAGVYVWKKELLRGKIEILMTITSRISTESKSPSIPSGRFVLYCNYLENNPEKLKEQYNAMTEKAKEIAAGMSTAFAKLPENIRKNRYTNISPFDDTRVKLLIDEDDEIGSDYINASYIKGFSGRIEYIATQGPLESTRRDFWKMVLQENVTIVVMVTQFSENDKVKCHHYFPNNHENMIISDDIEVRCATELHFGTYCVRNLQVRKDSLQVTVTHMQFLNWPDFGVPQGTENMLQFCYQMRQYVEREEGVVLVHCSAGVGRTGTLIATDILLQCIDAGRQIDVFNTVLELRKQRIFMVQTEKQYVYIHNLLRDHLDRPPSPEEIEDVDPVYENMDIVKQSEVSSSKWNVQESEF